MLQLIGVKVPFFPQFVCLLCLFHTNDFDSGGEQDQKMPVSVLIFLPFHSRGTQFSSFPCLLFFSAFVHSLLILFYNALGFSDFLIGVSKCMFPCVVLADTKGFK